MKPPGPDTTCQLDRFLFEAALSPSDSSDSAPSIRFFPRHLQCSAGLPSSTLMTPPMELSFSICPRRFLSFHQSSVCDFPPVEAFLFYALGIDLASFCSALNMSTAVFSTGLFSRSTARLGFFRVHSFSQIRSFPGCLSRPFHVDTLFLCILPNSRHFPPRFLDLLATIDFTVGRTFFFCS